LRDDYGFDGVVMTDDLSGMASITDRMTPAQAATRALVAGVDMVLFADADVPALVDALAAAVADGRLTEARVDEAVGRTLALKGVDPCAVDPDR
ncbi:MAG: glycoside hydrolase family 3 protein, partial [Acidimicrobiales bacterium]|nr:glycoside hydrolase family 3 protein [Acidimicrobiales bacterium]